MGSQHAACVKSMLVGSADCSCTDEWRVLLVSRCNAQGNSTVRTWVCVVGSTRLADTFSWMACNHSFNLPRNGRGLWLLQRFTVADGAPAVHTRGLLAGGANIVDCRQEPQLLDRGRNPCNAQLDGGVALIVRGRHPHQ